MIFLKSAREIEVLRRANVIVAEILQELKEKIAPGVTTADRYYRAGLRRYL
jgi:methionine aminopeptidase